MTEKVERALKLTTLQEFLGMSDEDMKKTKTSGNRMADVINTLWLSVRQLADAWNREAAEVDGMKQKLADLTYRLDRHD